MGADYDIGIVLRVRVSECSVAVVVVWGVFLSLGKLMVLSAIA